MDNTTRINTRMAMLTELSRQAGEIYGTLMPNKSDTFLPERVGIMNDNLATLLKYQNSSPETKAGRTAASQYLGALMDIWGPIPEYLSGFKEIRGAIKEVDKQIGQRERWLEDFTQLLYEQVQGYCETQNEENHTHYPATFEEFIELSKNPVKYKG